MTKYKLQFSIIALIAIIFSFSFAFSFLTHAQEEDNIDNIKESRFQVTNNEDYNFASEKTEFKSGDTITFDKMMNGERIGFAKDIIVNGLTEKNLVVAGGKIEINGDVNGSLFVAGEIIIINGNVKGNIYSAGSEVYINSEVVDGDIFVAAANNFIPSEITAPKLHLSNPNRETYTKGSVTKISDSKFATTKYADAVPQLDNRFKAAMIVWKIVGIISAVLFVYLLLVLFKSHYSKISGLLSSGNYADLILKAVIGFCLVIGLWIGSFILLFTGLGTLPALFIMLLLLIAWMYCYFISYYLVGSFVSKWLPGFADHRIVIAIVGVLVMVILSMIPIIGMLANILHTGLGFAVFAKFIMDKFQSIQNPTQESIE